MITSSSPWITTYLPKDTWTRNCSLCEKNETFVRFQSFWSLQLKIHIWFWSSGEIHNVALIGTSLHNKKQRKLFKHHATRVRSLSRWGSPKFGLILLLLLHQWKWKKIKLLNLKTADSVFLLSHVLNFKHIRSLADLWRTDIGKGYTCKSQQGWKKCQLRET